MVDTETAATFADRRQQLEALLSMPGLSASSTAEAHYVLWELCLASSDREAAFDHLDRAMRIRPVRARLVEGVVPQRSVLLLAAPGDLQANLPVEFLLDGKTDLRTLRIADPNAVLADPTGAVRAAFRDPASFPFDCVMIVIAESAARRSHLRAADALAAELGKPVVNRGALVSRLSRTGAAILLADLADAVVPQPRLLDRTALEAVCPPLPFLLRPSGSHAGNGLRRVETRQELRAALESVGPANPFVVTPFVDYRSSDGLYRKYRIAFVGGKPFPVHLAIHDAWPVWYYNAGMACFAARRDEEASFLEAPDAALPARARRALAGIAERVGLDYFGLDCGVLDDGRLLLFEVETGMIVHDRDPPDLFPAKREAARRVAAALETLIDEKIAAARIRSSHRCRLEAPKTGAA